MFATIIKTTIICVFLICFPPVAQASSNNTLAKFKDYSANHTTAETLALFTAFEISSSNLSAIERAELYFLFGQVYEKARKLDLAIQSYDKSIAIVKALPVSDLLINNYLERSYAVYLKTNNPSLYCIDRKKALLYARRHANTELLTKALTQNAFCYDNPSTVYLGIELLDEAMELTDKSDKINVNRKAMIYNATGNLYRSVGLHELGYSNFEKAYQTWMEVNDKQDMFNMQYNMFSEALVLGDWDKANSSITAQLLLAKTAPEFKDFYFFSYLNAGRVALQTQAYDKAIVNFEKAISLKHTTSEQYFVTSGYLYLALAYMRSGQPEKAAIMAQQFKLDTDFRKDKKTMILKADAIVAFGKKDHVAAVNALFKVIDEVEQENQKIIKNKAINSAMAHSAKLTEFENELLENKLAINELMLTSAQDKERIANLKLTLYVTLLLTAIGFLLHYLKTFKQQAQTDFLTGIANRRHTLSKGTKLIEEAIKCKQPVSVILFDIDDFKAINDTYGHQVGDATLKALTKRATNCISRNDLFGRIGGEEFLIILPNTSEKEALVISERLRESIASTPIKLTNTKINFTISLGLTVLKNESKSLGELIKKADFALYQAKDSGKNKVNLFLQTI
ncbi:tetratricopeptide repeat-containing diguanylate cyclase [Shewanella sp.]|uniref:tetratricopeptide repeat-containing diguanylate cyclase n=1 Tax=Shewanella sp. TaxID=50422 RepID=UPI004054181F